MMAAQDAVTVLAVGAWLKNAACLLRLRGDRIDALHWSPLHGDLGSAEACIALEGSVRQLLDGAGGRIDAVAHDLHPDFHSTRVAERLAAELGVPAMAVQHHLAHVAVVCAEQGLAADEPVIGIALDGVGLGSDGSAWGGELLRVRGASAQRVGHLLPLALPGGDAAAREPWRMAAAVLHASGRGDQIEGRFGPTVGPAAAALLQRMLARGLNCPATTSTGRWFDAAAAALGLWLTRQHEAEAAIALEQAAARAWPPVGCIAPAIVMAGADGWVIDLRPPLADLFDVGATAAAATTSATTDAAAAAFHAALAQGLADATLQACAPAGARTVVLAGGCFFNRLLSERLSGLLHEQGLQVLRPESVSCGDAGLALGQAWVAAQRLRAERAQRPEEISACA